MSSSESPESNFFKILGILAAILGIITTLSSLFLDLKNGEVIFRENSFWIPSESIIHQTIAISYIVLLLGLGFLLTLLKILYRDIKAKLKYRHELLEANVKNLNHHLAECDSNKIPHQTKKLQEFIEFETKELELINKSLIKQVYNAIVISYKKDQAKILFRFLFALRLVFLLAVMGNTTYELSGRDTSQSIRILQLHVSGAAIVFWLVFYKIISKKVTESDGNEDKKINAIDNIFWSSAKVDLLIVTSLIWLCPRSTWEVQLGYLLPLMVTWLSSTTQRERAAKVFITVIFGLAFKALLETLLVIDLEKVINFVFNIGNAAERFAISAAYILPTIKFALSCFFWGAISVIFALLRFLRVSEKINAHEALEYSQREHFLRSALELLCTSLKNAIFIKNADKSFRFANKTLLESLPPRKDNKPWTLELLEGETNFTIGIENEKYDESDHLVLNAKSIDDENNHFEGMEPTFKMTDHPWKRIWTVKHAIWDPNNQKLNPVTQRPIGLVGQVVEGRPIQMQQMADQLTEAMPIYATMKDRRGQVIWANKKYLRGMAGSFLIHANKQLDKQLKRNPSELEYLENSKVNDINLIKDLIENLQKVIDSTIDQKAEMAVLEQGLQQYNDGDGPTDIELYGSDLPPYFVSMDTLIKQVVEDPTIPDELVLDHLSEVIKEHFRNPKSHGPIVDYPLQGWIEHHKFPGEADGRWVSVRKIPTWINKPIKSNSSPGARKLKYLMVFFEDVHKLHLRRSILGRWSKKHLPQAKYAALKAVEDSVRNIDSTNKIISSQANKLRVNNKTISSKTKDLIDQRDEALARLSILEKEHERICKMPLLRVQLSLFNWAREIIEEEEHLSSKDKCDFLELQVICRSMELFFESRVRVDLQCHVEFLIESLGEEFLAIVVILLMNAMRAVERCSAIMPGERSVNLNIDFNDQMLNIVVSNRFTTLSDGDIQRINSCQVLDEDCYPGGGIYIANRLLNRLLKEKAMTSDFIHSVHVSYDLSNGLVKSAVDFPIL